METKTRRLCLVLLVCLLVACLLSLMNGSVWISPGQLLQGLGNPDSSTYSILVHIRLPRMAGALFAGAGLAASGMILQNVLNNPLAAPNIIGIHTGSGLAITLASVLFPSVFGLRMPAAFAGALAGCLLVFYLASRVRASRITIVLAGMAVSQIFMAGTDLLISVSDTAMASYTDFKIGSLSGLSFSKILPGCICIAAGLLLGVLFSSRLEILSLGEETASSLGLHVKKWMLLELFLAALLSAGAVSFCGLIGFVGLLCPQMLKRAGILKAGDLFVSSALAGSLLLVVCDLLSRVLFAPYEVPVGILLSLLGGPFFLWLLLHERRHARD